MSESAGIRASRRLATAQRIKRCALHLTAAHGLDGWTMADLARAAEVSRRTLFNHVPGKLDAVIGAVPVFPAGALAVFLAGGPHGRLVEDLRVLARELLEGEELDFDRDSVALRRSALVDNPRLLVTVHDRFEEVVGALVDHILEREGADFGAHRARLLVRILIAVFDTSLQQLLEDPASPPLVELLDASIHEARTLLA